MEKCQIQKNPTARVGFSLYGVPKGVDVRHPWRTHFVQPAARHPGIVNNDIRDLRQDLVEYLLKVTVALQDSGYCYSQFRDDGCLNSGMTIQCYAA